MPPRYQRIIPIQDDIVAGVFRIGAGDAVIGKQLAADLGLRVGDKLRLDGGQGRESVVNVAGIFELGVRELDARYVYLDMKQAQSLLNLPGAATVIDVTVDDIFDGAGRRRAHRPPDRAEGGKLDGDQCPADERAALAEPVHRR